MKIALLLKSKRQAKSYQFDQAIVFDVEKDKVVGVENATLESKDVSALTSWAQKKKVKEIYTPYADDQLRSFLNKIGISLKGYDELSDNRLFQTFIFI
jgi:NADH/NAD ratio-sensing transcriptional regulator Rex